MSINHASGDTEIASVEQTNVNLNIPSKSTDISEIPKEMNGEDPEEERSEVDSEHEYRLKERINQCRTIIESLKVELNEEKARFETDSKTAEPNLDEPTADAIEQLEVTCPPDLCSCVENKLACDEGLIQYEKQLQRYQDTLNMAQMEKKNAIRKQMIVKAYKLKLLELENQCNIELLRVKQSLQCLEPLKMIANSWTRSSGLNALELMPRYPELYAVSGSDVSPVSESENKTSATTPDQ